MTILLGIACLRYSSPLWALAKGFGLLIVVALGDVDSGIATTLIILIAFLGSTRDGGTV